MSSDVAKCFLGRTFPCWSTNTYIQVVYLPGLNQESAGRVSSYLLRNLAEQQLSVAHLVVGLLQLRPQLCNHVPAVLQFCLPKRVGCEVTRTPMGTGRAGDALFLYCSLVHQFHFKGEIP